MFSSVNLLKIHRDRVLPGLVIIDIAHSVRRLIGLPILVIRDLVLALVQANIVLHEQQGFIIVEGRPKRSREV